MLSVDSLTKEYKGSKGARVRAIDEVSFTVEEGEFLTLLGPSGCGKTTTLRCIAGLERPLAGEITISGRTVYSSGRGVFVQPNERRLGMVFQSYAIWPHMDVFANVAFPLRVGEGKRPRAEVATRVERVLDVVGLGHLADRFATQLSGGQQQRLALARALVIEPSLLLLDEPLSNLDAKLRESLRFELKRLQREQGITTVYVTHDQGEALSLSNRVAVMDHGRVAQIDKPGVVYSEPATRFVADFIGTTNFVPGRYVGSDGALHLVETEMGPLRIATVRGITPGDACVISIRPEQVEIGASQPESAGSNRGHGQVQTRLFMGEFMDYQIVIDDVVLRVRGPVTKALSTGDGASVHLPPEHCVGLADGG